MMAHLKWRFLVWNNRRKRRNEEAFNVCYMMSTSQAPVHWWNRGVQERVTQGIYFPSRTWKP